MARGWTDEKFRRHKWRTLLSSNVPLDPRTIEAIEEATAGFSPATTADFRRREIERAQTAANRRAVHRRRYREALALALEMGDPDPKARARKSVWDQHLVDVHNRQVAAIFRKVKKTSRKRADKSALRSDLASKTAKTNSRRSPQLDKLYVDIVGEAEKQDKRGDAALVLPSFPKILATYKLPHWEKTSMSLKVMAMSVEAAKEGAQTINLRLHPSVRAKALRSSRGPASYMQDAIRRAFRSTFGPELTPEFWFVMELEGSNADEFHRHGAVVTPAINDGLGLVNEALCKAAGGWDGKSGAVYQQQSDGVDEPIYWASYCTKTMNITGREIDRKLFASTLGIRQAAQNGWDALRKTLPQAG